MRLLTELGFVTSIKTKSVKIHYQLGHFAIWAAASTS